MMTKITKILPANPSASAVLDAAILGAASIGLATSYVLGDVLSLNHSLHRKGGKAPLLIDPCREGPSHSLMIIGSGGYKTTTALSTLLHWTGSAVILDPASEIAPMLREARERMGQTVFEIDPSSGIGFNVLDWIDIKSLLTATNIDSVVSWICGDTKPASKKDDFFDATSRNVVRCFLAHLLFDPKVPAKLKTLRALRQAIALPAHHIREVLRGIFENSPSAYASQLAGLICGLVDETLQPASGACGQYACE
jgi:type IV secretion system protein VirD4